eukprot:TRINITY_DN12745_c0_g1_i1.p1 TRINITY_DN12745_c0_g1~~TRINITY_DN12745_c0_g1_i1.p1  ORF type:complete len:338 (-),score=52.75 TRINITY_DN12745_c0_g1_i1:173-1186(-)
MEEDSFRVATRSSVELKSVFAKYPSDRDGFLKSFDYQDDDWLGYLNRWGFVVLQVLTESECDATVEALFEELNQQALATQATPLNLHDSTTWENENWPSPASRFLTRTMAIHPLAWRNRTHPAIHAAFAKIFGRQDLWASVDRWGVFRGTKGVVSRKPDGSLEQTDRPDWRHNLALHWDVNPWRHCRELDQGQPPMCQGVLAIVDCPEEVGGFLTVPGSPAYTRSAWVNKQPPLHDRDCLVRVPEHDPMQQHVQRVPLRKGQIVIWNSLGAHANFPNSCDRMRLVQFIRMMPAETRSEERDRFAAGVVLRSDPEVATSARRAELTGLGRRLLNLEPW